MKRIKANDLKIWASTKDCQQNLPLLIRRLIRATAIDISNIHFPTGESVVRPGYDGTLEVSEGTEYIPEGHSVWEIGCNQNPKSKATTDYDKRKKNPLGVDTSNTTFVFVTPRYFDKKEKWCEERKKEGIWKDVIVYDCDNLEEWLEQAPAVSAWFSQLIGISTKGVISLDDWWDIWSNSTEPAINPNLILAGREQQVKETQEWLNSDESWVTVQASSIDEAIAFLCSMINILPDDEREYYLSRSLIITKFEDFQHVSVSSRNPLLLIQNFEKIEGINQAAERGHNVYIPLSPDNKVTPPKIVLPILKRESFILALKEMGFSDEEAEKYSKETSRDIIILRRQLSKMPNPPEWAKADSAGDIIPALLAGSWIESRESDKEIISKLARLPYESFSKKIYSLQHIQDPPVSKIGDLWRIRSHKDAWNALSHFITADDLDNFKKVVLEVLSSIDPALDLDAEERSLAQFYGKVPKYSKELREGLVYTLILIAIYGDRLDALSTTSQIWVDNIIRELLNNADWKLWNSLADVLPLIAEASPNSFMGAVESSLSSTEKHIMKMFEETRVLLTPTSKHSHLLWALEGLAWSPDLLSRVTLILGNLANLDPGGSIGKRPINSLRGIFLLWSPFTYANLKERIEVIDTLLKRQPDIGWDLLVKLMPKSHDIGEPTSKTRWRQFSDKEDKVTLPEHLKSIKEIVSQLLAHVEDNGNRWVEIMAKYSDLPSDQRDRIIEFLSSRTDTISIGRSELWNKLRKIISNHRSFSDADWALPEIELKRIEEIYLTLEPEDTLDKFSWLFDEVRPSLIKGTNKVEGDWKEEEIFSNLRLEALKAIKSEEGFESILKLAENTQNPYLVGQILSKLYLNKKEREELLDLLDESNKKKEFVQNYILYQSIKFGDEFINKLTKKARLEKWPEKKIVNLFDAFPRKRSVWDLLDFFDEKTREGYWKQCYFRLSGFNIDDKVFILEQLVNVKRNLSSLHIAAFNKDIPAKIVAEILFKAATEESDESININYFDVEALFEVLDNSDITNEEVARLEWFYLPILASHSSRRPPQMLHNELSTNPEFFVEVMRYAYNPKDETVEEEEFSEEFLKNRAKFALKLIDSWKTVPGTDDGKIDHTKLKSWVEESRKLCKEANRDEIGDQVIGQILSYSNPEGEIWPPEAVCEVIDSIQSENLDTGFYIGTRKKRGIYTKSLEEGGIQETELANTFRNNAKNRVNSFPRTAAVLNEIAESYENESIGEDNEATKMSLE